MRRVSSFCLFFASFCTIFSLTLKGQLNAHTSSQSSLLDGYTYENLYGVNHYYLGGESVGWSIDENYHTNGVATTYSFDNTDAGLTSSLKMVFVSGTLLWNGTISFTHCADGSGKGRISTVYDDTVDFIAVFSNYCPILMGI